MELLVVYSINCQLYKQFGAMSLTYKLVSFAWCFVIEGTVYKTEIAMRLFKLNPVDASIMNINYLNWVQHRRMGMLANDPHAILHRPD